MAYDMNNLFGDLDQKDLGAGVEEKIAAAPKFPCLSCGGTGVYKGVRVHQPESKCFACGGKGFHKKDHWEVMKDKKSRKAKRENTIRTKQQSARDAFMAANPGFVEVMVKNAMWNNFCAKLSAEFNQEGKIPGARAIEIVWEIEQKSKDREAARQAERDRIAIAIDYTPIHKMFDAARSNGLKRMMYRAEGFVMTPASPTGNNAGAIYIKREGGEYLGKVANGKLFPSRSFTGEDKSKLEEIARNPLEAAKAYGKLTGRCCMCGKGLTDHVSIALGIGPICAERWGFMGSDAMPADEAKAIRKEGRARQNKIIRDAAIEAGAIEAVEKSAAKNSPKSVAGKYDAFYTSDMTPAQKKALRAKLRKGQKS